MVKFIDFIDNEYLLTHFMKYYYMTIINNKNKKSLFYWDVQNNQYKFVQRCHLRPMAICTDLNHNANTYKL